MTNNLTQIKLITCIICDALVRNINDNFLNVSFEIRKNEILVKIILKNKTNTEQNYIEDFSAELEAAEGTNSVRPLIIEIGINKVPLNNIVYQRG